MVDNNATTNMLYYEQKAKANGLRFFIGVDEAGRGPLAGPVVASAVMLRNYDFESRVTDSKKMTHRQREKAFHEIFHRAIVGIGVMNEKVIDDVNILNATHLAMDQAVDRLVLQLPEFSEKHTEIAVDGNMFKTQLPYRYRTVVKGDSVSLSIACASIIAKVYRDRILGTYDALFPQYGFKKHKGYPTKAHRDAIKEHGFSLIHRRSFTVK